MKIVKLRKNQRLHKAGYTHAFRFDSWMDDDYGKVLASLNKIYNNRPWRGKYYAWKVDSSGRYVESNSGRWVTKIWVGVRNEVVTTQVLMIKNIM